MLRPTSTSSSRTISSFLRHQALSSSRSSIAFTNRRLAHARFASTASPGSKSGSWRGRALRWGLAGGAVYFYNTSPLFAEEQALPLVSPDALRDEPNSKNTVHTLESLAAERQKLKHIEAKAGSPNPSAIETGDLAKGVSVGAGPPPLGSETPSNDPAALEEEAGQQGAFNPETGEINWDCPCLGGMATGPCGENFKEAFSCFVYSKEDPKGMDCIDKFKAMQDCFRQYPDVYGAELEGDDEDGEGSGEQPKRAENEGDRPEVTQATIEPSKSTKSSADQPPPLERPTEPEKPT